MFAAEVRQWPGVPHCGHVLIDQSAVAPEEVRGELGGRIAQLAMMAAYRDGRLLLEQVVSLLRELPAVGGIDYLLPYVVYVQATQDEETWRRFSAALRRDVARGGEEVIDYAERLIERGKTQGREQGRLEGRVGTIEDLLRAGVEWPMIESATGIDRDAFQALKQGIDGAANGTE